MSRSATTPSPCPAPGRAAKARGVRFGRPEVDPVEVARKVRAVEYLVSTEGATVEAAAKTVGWSRATYYRHRATAGRLWTAVSMFNTSGISLTPQWRFWTQRVRCFALLTRSRRGCGKFAMKRMQVLTWSLKTSVTSSLPIWQYLSFVITLQCPAFLLTVFRLEISNAWGTVSPTTSSLRWIPSSRTDKLGQVTVCSS